LSKDVAFIGVLGSLVSLLFVYISTIEIPFYARWEVHVRELAIVCLVISLVVTLLAASRR
jgi:hypothetical protein